MIMEIARPRTVKEAVVAGSRPGAAYLGGGTWLNSGKAQGTTILVSLERLSLGTIETSGSRCVIGATVTFQRLIDTTAVPHVLQMAAALTASRTLRNMKTLGGELALCPDDSALIPTLMVLDAEVTLAGRKKPVPVEEFARDRPNGLILSVAVPDRAQPATVRALSRTSHSGKSLVVAACLAGAGSDVVEARVVMSDCCGQRVRLRESALRGAPLPEKARIEGLARRTFSPKPDLHASAEYKRYMAGVMVADALHELAAARVKS
jgi:probable selenate reductase FAD-binding subunit